MENATESRVEDQTMTPTEKKRLDFSRRFKPCMLVMFYAHGHRVNDYKVTEREVSRQENGTEVSKWRTTKTVLDPENSKKAMGLRAKFIGEVCKLGSQYGSEKLVFVNFERADDVEALKVRWAEEVKAFNLSSPVVKVNFGILPPLSLTGSNEYLLGNLLDELKTTMGDMREALESADYKGVREVVSRLKGFVTLVPDAQASLITAAIADARKQARQIKSKLEKKGEQIQQVQQMISTSTVDIAVAACFGDDIPEVEGPSVASLMEAQAEEFCAAIQDDGTDNEESPPVVDEGPAPDGAPVVDPEDEEPPAEGYGSGDVLAAAASDVDRYWV